MEEGGKRKEEGEHYWEHYFKHFALCSMLSPPSPLLFPPSSLLPPPSSLLFPPFISNST